MLQLQIEKELESDPKRNKIKELIKKGFRRSYQKMHITSFFRNGLFPNHKFYIGIVQ
jgi:hypothetical protein